MVRMPMDDIVYERSSAFVRTVLLSVAAMLFITLVTSYTLLISGIMLHRDIWRGVLVTALVLYIGLAIYISCCLKAVTARTINETAKTHTGRVKACLLSFAVTTGIIISPVGLEYDPSEIARASGLVVGLLLLAAGASYVEGLRALTVVLMYFIRFALGVLFLVLLLSLFGAFSLSASVFLWVCAGIFILAIFVDLRLILDANMGATDDDWAILALILYLDIINAVLWILRLRQWAGK